MTEVLEGVLSEAILDELAADLGCDARLLRKHPFFRVLKGRVLLTYPLKVSPSGVFTHMEPVEATQVDPVNSQKYLVFYEEDVRIKCIHFIHNYTEARKCQVLVTVDGVEYYVPATSDVPQNEFNFVRSQDTSLGGLALEFTTDYCKIYLGGDLEGKKVRVEMVSKETIDGGKHIQCAVYYDQVV